MNLWINRRDYPHRGKVLTGGAMLKKQRPQLLVANGVHGQWWGGAS